MNDLVGFYLRISYWYEYRKTYALLKKYNLHLKNLLSSNNKSKQQSTFKSKQQSMSSCRCKYNALYNLIFSYL